LLIVLLATGCENERSGSSQPAARTSTADEELARAAAWLWAQQAEDGGWHSQTYGLLRSGQALTPFVLNALLDVPEEVAARPPGATERALAFLRLHLNADAAIGLADPDVLEYPNYSTAYALLCFEKAGAAEDRALVARMERYLLQQQFDEARGFNLDHPAYGGWGFGERLATGVVGHMDLAHTRRVLEALRASECSDTEAFQRAQHFLRLVQRHSSETRPQPALVTLPAEEPASDVYDGGFYFSPIVLAANKGREEQAPQPHFRSYATATCDGLLALLAAGVSVDDERVQKAADWLRRHPELTRPEGIPLDHPEPWHDALHFYHLAVRSEVYSALNWPGDWREQIRTHLAAQQQGDGSFANTRSHLMKEDDPLLCTALAVIALNRPERD
jgi:hypothetical protein